MIDKNVTLKLGDKVKFSYSWLIPTALHHQTLTIADHYTDDGKSMLLLERNMGEGKLTQLTWLLRDHVRRAGELVT